MSAPLVNKKIILREEGDEAFLFDPDTGAIKTLNETGVFIWKLCDGSNGKKDIVDKIVDSYDVKKESAEKDVEELLIKLKEVSFISYE